MEKFHVSVEMLGNRKGKENTADLIEMSGEKTI